MRKIGEIDNELHARQLGDYLYVEGMDNEVEEGSNGQWAIWVLDDDHLERAHGIFERFLADPDKEIFRGAADEAEKLRTEFVQEDRDAAARTFDRDRLWPDRSLGGMGYLTVALIAISVVITLATAFGKNPSVRPFLLSEYTATPWWAGFPEIKNGQVWRLLTPIFVHFSIIHILFNMLWLRDLGSMIERVEGTPRLGMITLLIGVVSNMGQYAFGGPLFGGMSGVVYGLLGYIWIKGKHDPGGGLILHQSTVTFMIVWFFLCLGGFIGNVANAAHGFGLVMGMGWGYLSALRRTR